MKTLGGGRRQRTPSSKLTRISIDALHIHLSKVSGQEFESIQAEAAALRAQIASCKQEARLAREEAEQKVRSVEQREREKEASIQERVRQTIARKDARIADLQKVVESKEGQLQEFQYLLQRQREDLLGAVA